VSTWLPPKADLPPAGAQNALGKILFSLNISRILPFEPIII